MPRQFFIGSVTTTEQFVNLDGLSSVAQHPTAYARGAKTATAYFEGVAALGAQDTEVKTYKSVDNGTTWALQSTDTILHGSTSGSTTPLSLGAGELVSYSVTATAGGGNAHTLALLSVELT